MTLDVVCAVAGLVVVQLLGVALSPVVMLALVLAWPAVLAASGCYRDGPFGSDLHARRQRVLRSGALLGLTLWVGHALLVPGLAPAELVPATVALTLGGLVSATAQVKVRAPRVVIVGHPSEVEDAIAELQRSERPVHLAAVCLTEHADTFADLPVHVGVERAAGLAAEYAADSLLVLPGPDLTAVQLRRLQWQAAQTRTTFYLGTGLLDVAPVRLTGVQSGGLGALQVRPAPAGGPRRLLKDVTERIVAATALLVLLPVLLTVAVAVRRDTSGPAIFRQQRVGRGGRAFTMYKFRTMTTSAPDDTAVLEGHNDSDGCLFKLRDDPRITRVGHVLRRYSVDELPQLWNVVAGQMSLVGPRPALPTEVERYDDDPRRRLAVKPGLTGLWQVSGRSDLSWEESVRLDLQYVDNWSLGLDVSILRRTVGAVLGHRGAY
ncbi:exopolysaccharide biosynthesis polyprenyl glycosylphosphotransferase [Nocardioides sp. GXQ0305]|uniref:exopolysaccharide biosynthesis polyprenyl glycosylphosphotransferase n=1 Tax=Nocardioides sp. GXQ0305 TaxID=3423912 RepID=UPI003D7C6E68